MGASRKLQGEIDRVLKKVQEGVDVFDSIWNKVYDTDNANQKEKFEADLKKEIKKLQRYRDQIKTWIQSSEIKDKKVSASYEQALMDARKVIEREMERFKICEKETKTKAFSKEGLGQQPKTDPKEKAKSETRDWLNNVVGELENQIDSFEAELEGLTVKKGRTRPPRLTHLETSIVRHKAHIMKLELILRLLDNDELSTDQVNDVKDFLDDYVERNQEGFDEFADVDEFYSSLPLDKVEALEDLVSIGPPALVKGVGAATISLKTSIATSPVQVSATITSSVEQGGSAQEQAEETASRETASDTVARTPPPKATVASSSVPTTPSSAAIALSPTNVSNATKDEEIMGFPDRKSSPALSESGLRGVGRGGLPSQPAVSILLGSSTNGAMDAIPSSTALIRPPRRINGSGHSGELDCHAMSSAFSVHDSPSSRNDLLLGRKDTGPPNHKGKHSFSVQFRKRENQMLNPELSSCKGGLVVNSTEQSRVALGLPGSSRVNEFKKGALSSGEFSYLKNMDNPSVSTNKVDKEKQIDVRSKVGVHVNHGERKESAHDAHHSSMKDSYAPVITLPRVVGKKRLVRNGCISPNNIAKAKQPVVKDHNGPITVEQNYTCSPLASSGSSKNPINVKDLVSEDHNSCSTKGSCYAKGKGVMVQPSILSEPNAESANASHRNIIDIDDEVNETTGTSQDTLRSFEEPGGWRSTRNRSQNRLLRRGNKNNSQNLGHYPMSEDLSSRRHAFAQPSSHMAVPLGEQSGHVDVHHSVVNSLGKRKKHGSTSINHGECSTSAFNDSDIMFVGPSKDVRSYRSDVNQNHRRRDTLVPTIEIDGSSPQARNHGSQGLARQSDEDATAKQVEADEMLARELQEQLYNEMPAFGVSEIDENLARALQQHAFSGETNTVVTRSRSVANSQRRSQLQSSTNVSRRASLARASNSNRLVRLRSRFPGRARTLSSPRLRNSIFPPNVNVETRIQVLEALEAFNNMGVVGNFLQTRQDFNNNDYEMLLALDENNHQHSGASVNLINGLPESVVQNENVDEPCAICLENPTIGDTIRHLPCLHKFHKDCIDPWLQRRRLCPVCKSSIS